MRHLAVTCTLLTCLLGTTAAQMTHEEQTVRASYAKLAYATRLGVLVYYVETATTGQPTALHTPSDIQNQMAHSVPVFEFENFKIGNTADIANVRWDTLATKPRQDLVNVGFISFPYRIKLAKSESFTEMNYAETNWNRYEAFNPDWSMPARDIFQELSTPDAYGKPGVAYSRYASYTVTIKLDGRQRTYQAVFLFGRNPDGTEVVYPIDHVLGMGSLQFYIEHSIYPQPLLETCFREWPGIREWIASAAIVYSSPVRDVVCDGISGKCGIPAQVLEKALQVPIDPEIRKFMESFSPKTQSAPQAASPLASPEAANPRLTALTASFGVCNKTKKLPQSEIFQSKS